MSITVRILLVDLGDVEGILLRLEEAGIPAVPPRDGLLKYWLDAASEPKAMVYEYIPREDTLK
jgi:hypothetical protein